MFQQAVITEQKGGKIHRSFLYPMIALFLISFWSVASLAQAGHVHSGSTEPAGANLQQKNDANGLIQVVRQATEEYKDVSVAVADGYTLQFGCVSGPEQGAMGLPFVNGALVAGGELDPRRPQIVSYEPTKDGRLHLIGADFLVLADDWNKNHSAPPELMGQLFHLFKSPNRFGLPDFHTLHV
jgi:hypothetical protein